MTTEQPNLKVLAETHIERLVTAIDQAKQMAEGHKQKVTEFSTQVEQLEAELVNWRAAIEE